MGGNLLLELLLYLSTYLISFLSFLLLFILIRINSKINRWEIQSLCIIPILFGIGYSYIAIGNILPEVARGIVRPIVTVSFGVGVNVAWHYFKSLAKGGN